MSLFSLLKHCQLSVVYKVKQPTLTPEEQQCSRRRSSSLHEIETANLSVIVISQTSVIWFVTWFNFFLFFVTGLSETRSSEEKAKIVDEFFRRYEEQVAANPDEHAMDYVHAYIVIEKKRDWWMNMGWTKNTGLCFDPPYPVYNIMQCSSRIKCRRKQNKTKETRLSESKRRCEEQCFNLALSVSTQYSIISIINCERIKRSRIKQWV